MKQGDIIARIDEWGQTEPERVAYQDESCSYTYGQLKCWSDNLACHLTEALTDGEPIAVFGELDFEMLVCFIGAVKSGHSYIPIEAGTPERQAHLILDVARPAVILSIQRWKLATDIPVIEKGKLDDIFSSPLQNECTASSGNDTFYIIFTSGSTGVPKGVQISCDNLLSFLDWELCTFPIHSGMRFLSQAPYSFDLSVMSIFPALVSGGMLIPVGKELLQDFKRLFQLLPALQLEIWVSTPSFMEICLMEPDFDAQHTPSLTLFLFCGEELPHKTAEKLLERFPDASIYNTYGPAEATVAVSQIQITEGILKKHPRLPIGYVKEDSEVFIAENGRELPCGKSGEIIICGPSVSKGYLNSPEKSQVAFSALKGKPAYRTGDAGHMNEEGLLFYDGRIDFQIKWHGFRIELEDINHHLEKLDLVRQASVVPKYYQHKVQQLVAYVVPEKNDFQRPHELTRAIKKKLQEEVMAYMVPQKFVYLDRLPRTANGKIDRKSLMREANTS